MSTQQPLILLVASLSFILDARLREPLRRHYLAAAACLAFFLWTLPDHTHVIAGELIVRDWLLIGASAIAVFVFVKMNPDPVSYCDTSPQRLDRARVSAGLIVGWLMGVQALLTNGSSAWLATPIWICMIALLPSFVARQVSGIRRHSL